MSDLSQQFAQDIRQACETASALIVQGSQSKDFLSYAAEGTPLNTQGHRGIVAYEPTELVITARSGTSIADLQDTLAEQGQTLPFDPPQFNQAGTIGGTVATGLSGPSRPWAGAVRDHVLGTRIINGKGEILTFGGQVMKNVAGYDVSRLMTGAYGTLGLLLDISCKVLPLPEQSTTLTFECDASKAITNMNSWTAQALPLSAACWLDGILHVRLSGTQTGINAAIRKIGGDIEKQADHFWRSLRDHQHSYFSDTAYWRLSVPPATDMLPLSGEWLLDWGGAQRWLKTSEASSKIQQIAKDAYGHAEQWHDHDKNFIRMPLESALQRYHENLKAAFDPQGILNKGCLYPGL